MVAAHPCGPANTRFRINVPVCCTGRVLVAPSSATAAEMLGPLGAGEQAAHTACSGAWAFQRQCEAWVLVWVAHTEHSSPPHNFWSLPIAGILRNIVDVIRMLAGGALAGQSVVLAASLLQDSGSTQEQARHPSSSSGSSSGSSSSSSGLAGFLAGAKHLLLPTSLVEARVLAIVGVTRFLLLPALTLAGACLCLRWVLGCRWVV